jgi:hypothetical protein
VYNLNSLGGTLTGGTWNASGGATLAIDGGTISVLAANVTLNGVGSKVETGNGSTFTTIGSSVNQIAAGADLTLIEKAGIDFTATSLADKGTITLSTGATLTAATDYVSGLLSGNGLVKGGVSDSGTVTATGGSLSITGNLNGTGVLDIAASSNAIITGSLGVKSTVFASGTETLSLAAASKATTTISGFGSGDVIDLTTSTATTLTYAGTATAGTLTVDNGTTLVAKLLFSGDYTSSSFSLTATGSTALITGTGAAAVPPDFGLSIGVGHADVPAPSAHLDNGWTSFLPLEDGPLLLAHHGF